MKQTGEAQGLLHLCHINGETRVIAYRNKLIAIPGRDPYVLGFGVDITEQVRAEGRLRALTRQSNSILESVGDGIFGIDLDGIVTVVNSAAAQMLGYKPNEMLGRKMHDLIHHTRADGTPYPAEESPISSSLKTATPSASPTRSSGAKTAPAFRSNTSRVHRSSPTPAKAPKSRRPSASSSRLPIPPSAARSIA